MYHRPSEWDDVPADVQKYTRDNDLGYLLAYIDETMRRAWYIRDGDSRLPDPYDGDDLNNMTTVTVLMHEQRARGAWHILLAHARKYGTPEIVKQISDWGRYSIFY